MQTFVRPIVAGMVLLSGCERVLQLETDPSEGSTLCVPAQAVDYRLPSQRWALAAAHASRRLEDDPSISPELDPAWFLAVGWQATGFACADYGAPWVSDPDRTGDGGCLELRRETHHAELVKLFPRIYPDERPYEGQFAGDTPEASTLGLAWTLVASHALWGRAGIESEPATWYAQASDPVAAMSLSAALHAEGPFGAQSAEAVRSCSDDVLSCLSGEIARRVQGVLDKHQVLAAAPCLTEPLQPDAVREHVRNITTLWDEAEALAAETAALDALDGSGFHHEAPAVLDALDAHIQTRLTCPEATLWQVYSFSCP